MISYTQEDILNAIDTMTIYEKDYPTIKKILATNDSEFIAAVIEEVIKGKLFWSDFESILPENYEDLLEVTLKNQNEFLNKIKMISKFNSETELNEENFAIFPENNIWGEFSSELREDLLFSLTAVKDSDTVLTRYAKSLLLKAIDDGEIDQNNIMLSNGKLIIPIDYDYVILTDSDKGFMKQNNLNESEMKKIKATYLYLSVLNEKNNSGGE